MSGRVFEQGRNSFAIKQISWTADTQKAMLLDCTVVSTWLKIITGVTNANPAVYTSNGHGFSNGDIVLVGLVGGNLSTNQLGRVAATAANTFQLVTLDGSGLAVQGSAAYTSGGFALNLTQAQFVSDLNAGRIPGGAGGRANDATVTTPASSGGVLTAASIAWTGVTGNAAQAFILYDDAGSDATSRLIAINDGKLRVVCNKAAIAGDTAISVMPLWGALPSGSVCSFSDGHTATLSAPAAQGDRSITVTALAVGGVAVGSTAEVPGTNNGLPFTPAGGGSNLSITIGTVYAPGLPTGLLEL